MNAWWNVIIFSVSVLIGSFISGGAVELYNGWQWRKLRKRWEAKTAEAVRRLDE